MICRPLNLSRLIIVLIVLYLSWRSFKRKHYPERNSRIAKATFAVDSLDSSNVQRALRTHRVHNDLHGYRHYIATGEPVDDLVKNEPQRRPRETWDKSTYLSSLITAELGRLDTERAVWIFYFDADTIILNPKTALNLFLPQDDTVHELSNVHLLIANNWNGLDSSAFAIRVHPWSIAFLTTVSGYAKSPARHSNPEQSPDDEAIRWALQSLDAHFTTLETTGLDTWVEVPARWFNALPINNAYMREGEWIFDRNMDSSLVDAGTTVNYNEMLPLWKVMEGDMAVHFAGSKPVPESWSGPWLDRAEQQLPEWNNGTKPVELKVEVDKFWKDTAKRLMTTWERKGVNILHEKQKAMQREQLNEHKVLDTQVLDIYVPSTDNSPVLDTVSTHELVFSSTRNSSTNDPSVDIHQTDGSL